MNTYYHENRVNCPYTDQEGKPLGKTTPSLLCCLLFFYYWMIFFLELDVSSLICSLKCLMLVLIFPYFNLCVTMAAAQRSYFYSLFLWLLFTLHRRHFKQAPVCWFYGEIALLFLLTQIFHNKGNRDYIYDTIFRWNSVVKTPDFIHSASIQGPWKSTSCHHKTTEVYETIWKSLKNSGLVILATAYIEKTAKFLFPFTCKYSD